MCSKRKIDEITNQRNLTDSRTVVAMRGDYTRRSCWRPTMGVYETLSLLLFSVVPAVAQRALCPDGVTTGYSTLNGLSNDINVEATRIANGGTPLMMYVFNICPGAMIVIPQDESLTPRLSGSVFRCGNDGLSSGDCRFTGGNVQVNMAQSTIPGYPVSDVVFEGMTFTNFNTAALSGNADDATTVMFEDVIFTDYMASFGVQQSNGGTPFNVQVSDSLVRGASGGTVFSTDGGSLVIADTSFIDSNSAALVSSSGGAAVQATDIEVTGGSIEDGFMITGGSRFRGSNIEVSALTDIQGSLFDVSGSSTQATVENSMIVGNNAIPTTSQWTGVSTTDGAQAVVQNTVFADNNRLVAAVSATNGGAVRVERVQVESVSGVLGASNQVSSVVLLDTDAIAVIEELVVDGATDFTTAIFANLRSNVRISRSCLLSGNTQGAVYVSEESTYTVTDNFIDDAAYESLPTPTACPAGMPRLIKENPGSNCFEGSPCETTCETFADSTVCLAQVDSQPSPSPGSNTTTVPTLAPSPNMGNGTVAPSAPSGNATLAPSPTPGNGTLVPSIMGNGTIVPSPSPGNGTLAPTPTPGNGTAAPTGNTGNGTLFPTQSPGNATSAPTSSFAPSPSPTDTLRPTATPAPTASPTSSLQPSASPAPSSGPPVTQEPTFPLTPAPTRSVAPSATPTMTGRPTSTAYPTEAPFSNPPSLSPTITGVPTVMPSARPSPVPTISSMPSVSAAPSSEPTISMMPTFQAPSAEPSASPSMSPSSQYPSEFPTALPSVVPTESIEPSVAPSAVPSKEPTVAPTSLPTATPVANMAHPSNCDCRRYWYQGYGYGYSSNYGPYGNTGNNYGRSKGSKGKGGKGRGRHRQLPYQAGPPTTTYGYYYHYDPCWYYCQWAIHYEYSYGHGTSNTDKRQGLYGGGY